MNVNLNSQSEEKKERKKPRATMRQIFQIPKGMQKVINKKEEQLKKKQKNNDLY
jgi:hypothetical protein